MLKKSICTLYIILLVTMAAATVAGRYGFCAVYGSWWFNTLWAALCATGATYFIIYRVRRPSTVALHAAFTVILAGALLTHATSWQGRIHLRLGQTDGTLPFAVRLDRFTVQRHAGTAAPRDYISHITITDGDRTVRGVAAMNSIVSYRGYRLYQDSYDEDMRGSTLSVNYDPWGIPVTYTGYALLFLSLLWMLADPKGRFRRTLRATARPMALAAVLMTAMPAFSATTLGREEAGMLSRLVIDHNDRICPVETFALDFTKTVTGSRGYGEYTATQVLAGFMLFGEQWMHEPLISVKSAELRSRLGIGERCSAAAFFRQDGGGYILGPYLREYYGGNGDSFHKAVADMDGRLMLIMQVRHHSLLRIFPYGGRWYAPTDTQPRRMAAEQRAYVRNALPLLAALAHGGHTAETREMLMKMGKYQKRYGAATMPGGVRLKAEHLHNALPYTTILFITCLTLGLLSLLPLRIFRSCLPTLLCAAALTGLLALRWVIGGRIPMSNGYETMLLMAWFVLILGLALRRRFQIAGTFSLLLGGFFLLVSHLSQMSPQISHVMPVLQSPLLSLHVSVIMAAYAMLSITAASGVVALLSRRHTQAMTRLSILMLYPAMACLGTGIFIGAVWANVSWGCYWSWDPKETWALITFMLYAIPLHQTSLPALANPVRYHAFTVCAFASVVITYFGVNYLLGGMHSYA